MIFLVEIKRPQSPAVCFPNTRITAAGCACTSPSSFGRSCADYSICRPVSNDDTIRRDMEIKAVIFDVDGTLLDTREYIQQAYEHALHSNVHAVPSREVLQGAIRTGASLEGCYEIFAPTGDIVALRDTHRGFQNTHFELIVAYEGLIDLLSQLKDSGIKLGACSSRGPSVRPSLDHMQALSFFDAVVDATDVKYHKPHPEGVQKILSHLEVLPQNAVMIGDTRADIEAGLNAGVGLKIGVTHGFGTRDVLEEVGADYIVDSLGDIPPILAR